MCKFFLPLLFGCFLVGCSETACKVTATFPDGSQKQAITALEKITLANDDSEISFFTLDGKHYVEIPHEEGIVIEIEILPESFMIGNLE